MKFEIIGDKSKPAVLLIHGMLCTYKDCLPYGKYLSDEYYVIMPTLDGHGNDGTDMPDVKEEAKRIIKFLNENKINHLALLQGSSMGAEVALAVRKEADESNIKIDLCFFDGGPFFDFSPWFRAIMKKKFQKMVKIFDTDDSAEAERKMMESTFLKFVGKDKKNQYEPLVKSMADGRRCFSDKTVDNMVLTCYACKLPEFTEDEQKTFIFFFSKDEPARKSKKRLIKAYPNSEYIDIDGYAHCGYQTMEPKKYSDDLKRYIKKS